MLVFRESAGRRTYPAARLRKELGAAIAHRDALEALFRAAEIECALADNGSSFAADAATLTDQCAAILTGKTDDYDAPAALIPKLDTSGDLTVTEPEGLAYYGLHPLDYVEALHHVRSAGPIAVIGIRSI